MYLYRDLLGTETYWGPKPQDVTKILSLALTTIGKGDFCG